MAMNASVSAIQDMEKTLADTVRNLDTLSEKISTNFRPSRSEKATGEAETTGGTGTELSEPPV